MIKRRERELYEQLNAGIANANERITPITKESIGRKQPLTLLASRILAWPTHDLRADLYVKNKEPDISLFKVTDTDLMIDVVEGIELKVIRKDLSLNIIEVEAYFQTNLDEFERYNLTVEHHNHEWEINGSKNNVFHPITGEMIEILDSYVDPARITSTRYPVPEHVDENMSKGPLAKARPDLNRKPVLLIKYQLKTEGEDFSLDYVAYDKNNKVVYYNSISGKDLSILVRRSVQEIWGNPFIFGDSGSVLEGISVLIQGKKIPLCKEMNTRPQLLGTNDDIKEVNKQLQNKEMEQASLKFFERLLRIWVPIGTFIYFVWTSLSCLVRGNSSVSFIMCIITCAMILFISFKLSYYMDRRISQLDAEKKFI